MTLLIELQHWRSVPFLHDLPLKKLLARSG